MKVTSNQENHRENYSQLFGEKIISFLQQETTLLKVGEKGRILLFSSKSACIVKSRTSDNFYSSSLSSNRYDFSEAFFKKTEQLTKRISVLPNDQCLVV